MPTVLDSQIRTELSRFVSAAGNRRVLPPILHLGVPGSRRAADQYAIAEADAVQLGIVGGTRADLLERALDHLDSLPEPEGGRACCAWITRSGELSPCDVDMAWLAAAREGFGRMRVELPGFFVITRAGWRNLLNDTVIIQRGRRMRRRL